MPRPRPYRLTAGIVGGVAALALAACTSDATNEGDTAPAADDAPRASAGEQESPDEPLRTEVRVPGGGNVEQVAVDSAVSVAAVNGTLDRVVAYSGRPTPANSLDGKLSSDGGTWTLTGGGVLEPGLTYTVESTGTNDAGDRRTVTDRFSTDDLTLDEQTYASVAPLQGETVGVGMPVVVTFDVPVTDRAAIERHLSVSSSPQVTGTWHWMSDTEVHYRPKTFWPVGAEVDVDLDINSVDAGNGIYGQESRSISFDVGDSVVSRINLDTSRMRVDVNDETVRTIPVSGGKAGFETRSGTKVIMEKFESKRMDAATTGIQPGDPEYYNIANVEYAMRVTYSGEFLHAAPWSVGDQGSANVSHGCVGMSTEDAAWLYGISSRGDVVKVRGSDRTLEPGNGWTDWDVSFAEYKQGSALS